jgi:ribosome biogenesis protein Nip4
MNEIDTFIKKFTDKKIEYVLRGKTYFFVHGDNKLLAEKLNPLYAGLPLGESGEKFKPSVFLLEILSKSTNNKVFVNDKAEWLFLCGRDILPESVVKDNSREDVFLIQNKEDENIGLGRKVTHSGKSFIKNIIDRGDFLRRERK